MTSEAAKAKTGAGAPLPRRVLKTVMRLRVLLHRLTGGRIDIPIFVCEPTR